jgi:hypothetical protein
MLHAEVPEERGGLAFLGDVGVNFPVGALNEFFCNGSGLQQSLSAIYLVKRAAKLPLKIDHEHSRSFGS